MLGPVSAPLATGCEGHLGGPAVGMRLTFRAEVMPGRETDQRTYEVERVLSSGRIELANFKGEHHLTEFEPVPE